VTDVLLATDSDLLAEQINTAIGGPDTSVRLVRAGQDVRAAVERAVPDLVVLDLQIGNMGGMATCLDLRLESGAGRLPRVPVLMLLDRVADVFLAQQADADGWLVKPLDTFRIRRAVEALLAGNTVREPLRPIGSRGHPVT
jgi:DNA-binding response OmpR family regulator